MTTQLDIRVAYGYRINKTTRLEGFVNVFNLFDSQEELERRRELHVRHRGNPIVGGTPSDLEHVKTLDPATGQETNDDGHAEQELRQQLRRRAAVAAQRRSSASASDVLDVRGTATPRQAASGPWVAR